MPTIADQGCASGEFGARALLRLFGRCDALRRPERFELILLACECDARGRLGREMQPYPQRERLLWALRLVQAVDLKTIAIHQDPPLASGQLELKMEGRMVGEGVGYLRLAVFSAPVSTFKMRAA
mgnify:CR=1 FL=1